MATSLPPDTVLDVRPDLARGQEPFSKIMTAARAIAPGGRLVVLAPFEPEPLYGVLAKMGFSNVTEALGSEGFRVTFRREMTAEEP
jgi:uncharacterized protein (DUF2249 family)